MKKKWTEIEIALLNDNRLKTLAQYKETEGGMRFPKQNQKNVNDMLLRIQNRFQEFKRGVKRGSYTIDKLEKDIFVRYGVVEEDPGAVIALNINKPSDDFQMILDKNIDDIAKMQKNEREKK